MAGNQRFDEARRQLDTALAGLTSEEPPHSVSPAPEPGAPPITEVLTRLAVGVLILGLDAFAAQAGGWEQVAGITRAAPAAPSGPRAPGALRFRHGMIGWAFETEAQLRPGGNPRQWLRVVVGHLAGTVFSVVLDALPWPGQRRARSDAPASTDQTTTRWVARGRAEEERSRAFASAALADILDEAIPALAHRPGVQQALTGLVRSPAMDNAITTLAARPGVQQAIAELVRSPAIDDAITTLAARPGVQQAIAGLVRSPAIDDAITTLAARPGVQQALTDLVKTPAMGQAIETLAESPALVQLVRTQSTTLAGEIMEEGHQRAFSADAILEGAARKTLGRSPRSALPPEDQGLILSRPPRPPTYARYAGFTSRAVALVIDLLVISGGLLLFGIALDFLTRTSGVGQLLRALGESFAWVQPVNRFLLGATFELSLALLANFAYFTFFHSLGGATVGKHLLGLRVVSAAGERLTPGQAALRTLGYALSSLPLYLGFLSVIVNNRRRGWHDRIARTCVVHTWAARPDEHFLRRAVDKLG
ncbi:MAG: hypothetical protein OHK0015_50920 [Chloroflexi bacterium OHK40]